MASKRKRSCYDDDAAFKLKVVKILYRLIRSNMEVRLIHACDLYSNKDGSWNGGLPLHVPNLKCF